MLKLAASNGRGRREVCGKGQRQSGLPDESCAGRTAAWRRAIKIVFLRKGGMDVALLLLHVDVSIATPVVVLL